MDFLFYCHDYVSRWGGLHMVRLDYCILDHILPTGKPKNLTPVRLKNFEKKTKITGLIWIFILLGIYIYLNMVLPSILHNFFSGSYRLYRFSADVSRIFKRWLTFRNLYILFTDVVFLVAFILRGVAYYNGQCRYQCPYEGNEIAFVAGAVWSFAALLAFLRAIQIGLMWRQTGSFKIWI